MYNNVGSKIQGYSTFISMVGIIFSVIFAFVSIPLEVPEFFFVGILLALGFWVLGLFLCGFGQLVENVDKLVNPTKKDAPIVKRTVVEEQYEEPESFAKIDEQIERFKNIFNKDAH